MTPCQRDISGHNDCAFRPLRLSLSFLTYQTRCCASACISNDKDDFVGDLQPINIDVNGVGGSATTTTSAEETLEAKAAFERFGSNTWSENPALPRRQWHICR